MQLKTSHIIWVVVGLVALGNGDRIAGTLETSNEQQSFRTASSAERKESRQQAREIQKKSVIALDRVKAGCIPIVDKKEGKADFFNEGEQVLDPITEQPIREGLVCNKLGVTGVIVEGYITDLVMVSPKDKAEYLGYYVIQKGEL